MELSETFSAFNSLLNATCRRDVEDMVSMATASYGFRYWIYAQEIPPSPLTKEPFIFGTYPAEWVQHYIDHDYIHVDPVIKHSTDHVIPCIWPQYTDSQQTHEIRKFFGEARSFRLIRGISIPLHGPGPCRGLFSVAVNQMTSNRTLSKPIPDLMLMASFIHEATIRVRGKSNLWNGVKPTFREQECLSWAAVGKSSWEIGQLLNISERTVNFHLQNVGKKLGVNSRQAAVARAVSIGWTIL